jgi:hypothetical protein
MARRKTTTNAVRAAAKRNIAKAQLSRRGRKEPRSIGRVRSPRKARTR